MLNQNIPANKSSQQGVSIVEALVAILIFSIGVLGIVGMQANMIQNTSEAKNRSDASYIMQQTLGEMWAGIIPPPAEGGVLDLNIPAIPNGQLNIVRGSSAAGTGNEYTLTLTWQEPDKEQHRLVTKAIIAGS